MDSAEEVLEEMERSAPDVLITDLMMPSMSGFDLLKRIRADARWAALPVIVLTARSSYDDRRRVMEAGTTYYLTKPFSSAQLIDQVRKLSP